MSGKPEMNWNASDLAKEWKRFRQHCEFTFDGPLSEKTEKSKVGYLMGYVGDHGRYIYSGFKWAATAEGQPPEYETLKGVYAKFEKHVEPFTNHIRATVIFNKRRQTATEKFDNFVTDLKMLVKDCGYKEDDRMVRDAIVLRSFHKEVQEKCLEKGNDLTLDAAISIGRNHEASQESLSTINNYDEDTSVTHAVATRNRSYGKDNYRGNRAASNSTRSGTRPKQKQKNDTSNSCNRCGYARHKKNDICPAINQHCGYCNKRNHFASVCRQKSSANHIDEHNHAPEDDNLSESSDIEQQYSVGSVRQFQTDLISSVGNDDDEWYEDINIEDQTVRVQIDTGTKESIMPLKEYIKLSNKKLKKTQHQFESYSNHTLKLEGKATLTTQHKDKSIKITYFVVNANNKPILLSGKASKALGLINRVNSIDDYPELKTTTGTLPGTYSLKIDPTVKPVVHGPRKLPQALATKVKEKLLEMEQDGHITKVTEPTDWVSSMCTVLKGDKVRICIDPKDLNKAIRREHYPIPTIEEIVADMPGANTFSVIDAKSGFLQIKLDYESSLLTTFNTPIGRFRWLRLPFGIKSAPEIYQRIMDDMLHDIEGARAIMDDIIIIGRSEEEHDKIMRQVVERATEWNLKLNFDKCQIKQKSVKYVGHVLTDQGLKPNPDRVRAIQEMPTPTSKEDVRRFLGVIQYLSKFIPNLSEIDGPLREIMKKNVHFFWEKPQEKSFQTLKELCSTSPVLAYYDVNKEVTIQCDASSYALGGVLLQDGKPIAYTSRSMTETEKRYAQIEKEMLAIVHSCKKFHQYIFGKLVKVESDHKPLQAIFTKPLLSAPMRLQTMLLRLQPYDLEVKYKPGTDIPIGDALSRANLPDTEPDEEPIMVNMLDFVAVTPTRYKDFQARTADELNELYSMIIKGWPETRHETPHSIREYWSIRDELAVSDGIVYKGMKIVVPPSVRPEMLAQIHESHLGINKCKQRAREILFWPGMSQQVQNMVEDCSICNTYQNQQHKEPMKPSKIPDLPWAEVASDLFDWKRDTYLLTIDYYSKFIEVDKLSDLSSSSTIESLKTQFSRHGIPEILRTDNGPQFSSKEFHDFCVEYQIQLKTSSPHYPQSNGEAERAVQTVKNMWKKCKDKQLALLDYRTTPLKSCNLSPAQLLFGRRPRNKLPAARSLLQPKQYDPQEVKKRFSKDKATQEKYYNKKASTDLPVLQPGDPVRMSPLPGTNKWLPALVIEHHTSPRSYVVEYNGRKYRRNRKDLRLSTYHANNDPSFAQSKPKRSHPAKHPTFSAPPSQSSAPLPPRCARKPQESAPLPPQRAPTLQSSARSMQSQPPSVLPTPAREPPDQPEMPESAPHHDPPARRRAQPAMRQPPPEPVVDQQPPAYVTRSGRRSKPPERMDL